jgi:cell division protein ZapA (FtsZ GTPase activity inhibitor)
MSIGATPLKLEIFDEVYSVVSDEPEERVLEASMVVDDLMKELAVKAPYMGGKKLAILAALQLASDLVAAQEALADKNSQEAAVEAQIRHLMEINTDL